MYLYLGGLSLAPDQRIWPQIGRGRERHAAEQVRGGCGAQLMARTAVRLKRKCLQSKTRVLHSNAETADKLFKS
jgi:hypothetical protein